MQSAADSGMSRSILRVEAKRFVVLCDGAVDVAFDSQGVTLVVVREEILRVESNCLLVASNGSIHVTLVRESDPQAIPSGHTAGSYCEGCSIPPLPLARSLGPVDRIKAAERH